MRPESYRTAVVTFGPIGRRLQSWETKILHCTPGAIKKALRAWRALPKDGWRIEWDGGAEGHVVSEACQILGRFTVEFGGGGVGQ